MEALAELSISSAQKFIVRVSIYTTGMAKILLISVCFFFASTEALSLPSHNCSDYFTYGIDANGSYIGIFTADEAGVQKLNFSARFIFHGAKNVSKDQKIERYWCYEVLFLLAASQSY